MYQDWHNFIMLFWCLPDTSNMQVASARHPLFAKAKWPRFDGRGNRCVLAGRQNFDGTADRQAKVKCATVISIYPPLVWRARGWARRWVGMPGLAMRRGTAEWPLRRAFPEHASCWHSISGGDCDGRGGAPVANFNVDTKGRNCCSANLASGLAGICVACWYGLRGATVFASLARN